VKHELMPLPYDMDALAPHISRETLEYHYGKHHQTYVNTLNSMLEGSEDAKLDLESLVRKSTGKLFNQAAQVWNHNFYWQSLSPEGGGEPEGELKAAIEKAWGSVDAFRQAFSESTIANFASGWGWLVKRADGNLAIVQTDDADTPLTDKSLTPLLTCDIWEHAYYIDYRNARPDYLDAFWKLVNWEFAARNF
jgi:superoxide dismutase, Fe-Mn family